MTRDDLDYALSRRLDDDLPPAEAAAVARRLRADPSARIAFDEYAQIDEMLKAFAGDWADAPLHGLGKADYRASLDGLSNRLSAWEQEQATPAVAGRIGFPIFRRIPSLPAARWAGVAVAAGLAAAVGLGLVSGAFAPTGPAAPTQAVAIVMPAPPVAVPTPTDPGSFVAMVAAPTAEVAAGPAVSTVEVGPPAPPRGVAPLSRTLAVAVAPAPAPAHALPARDESPAPSAAFTRPGRVIIAAAPISNPRGGPY